MEIWKWIGGAFGELVWGEWRNDYRVTLQNRNSFYINIDEEVAIGVIAGEIRWATFEFLNLGFSGKAKRIGRPAIFTAKTTWSHRTPTCTKQPWDFRHRGARPLNTWRNRTNRIGRGRRGGVGARSVRVHVHAYAYSSDIYGASDTRMETNAQDSPMFPR